MMFPTLAWLRQLARAGRRRPLKFPRRRFAPALEALETRTVPSTIFYEVTGTADGLGTVTPTAAPGVFDASTLRAAVIAANADTTATDTIFINLPAGTYNLTVMNPGDVPEDAAASGDLDITNGIVQSVNLQSVGGQATIDASGLVDTVTGVGDRAFSILPTVGGTAPTVTMTGLTIQGGHAPTGDFLGNGGETDGGGILNEGNLTLTDCVVQNNVAHGLDVTTTDGTEADGGPANGGGIFNAGSSLTLVRTRVVNNQAVGGTGTSAPANSGVNFASGFGQGGMANGGGISSSLIDQSGGRLDTAISLTDSTVSDNVAQGGGASGDYGGFGGEGDGGGLSTPGFFFGQVVTVQINSSTIARNQANGGKGFVGTSGGSDGSGNGGGIDNTAVLTALNSTISSNSAWGDGGGIREATPDSITLHNDTLTANVADANNDGNGNGGGVWSDDSVTVQSTIIAGNFDTPNNAGLGVINPDVTLSRTVVDQGFNLIGDTTGDTSNAGGTSFSAANHDLFGDPGLLPLANNGGLTETNALKLTSQAIDKGSNPDGLTFDQRESPFLRTVGPQTDIGAYEVQYGSLSGFVYRDNNDNGVFEPGLGETGIPSVILTLTGTTFQGVAVNRTTTTGPTGAFSFGSLPPSNGAGYTLTETQPGGFFSGKNAVGTINGVPTGSAANVFADTVSGIVVGDGGNGVNYDFGELAPSSLAGFVYQDNNHNGVFEPALGEPGLPGVPVTLTGTDDQGTAVNQPTTTGGDGSYSFANLRPGTYTITETHPAGFLPGQDTQGTPGNGTVGNGQFANITLAAGVNGANNNFAELVPSPPPPPPPPPPTTAQLSGFIFDDLNGDGIFEPQLGEAGLANVPVSIKAVGDPTVLTGAGGFFVFTGLPAGIYVLTVSQPAGFSPGTPQIGTAGGVIVNNDQVTAIALPAGARAAGYLFPEVPVGAVSSFPVAVVTPTLATPPIAPTLLGKVELLGSGVTDGSTGDMQGFANFVNGLYNDVLGRAPATAEVNFWVNVLLNGVPRQAVAAAIWESPEHRGEQVDRFYQLFLHRAADAGGRAYWVNVFLSGANEYQVAAGFLTAQANLTSAAGIDAYVSLVYRDVLGRPLDAAGRIYWVGGLEAGRFTAAQVAYFILTSPEASLDLAGLYYGTYLHQSLTPDATQFALTVLYFVPSPSFLAEVLLASDIYYALPH